jgi:peptidase E
VQALSNGGFGCYLLFDHNWAPFAAKKRHYEIFGNYVVPHFKQTNRRLQQSEAALRKVRDPLAQAQQEAIAAFRARHDAEVRAKSS